MEMKMILSTPRTISSAVRVKSAIHASGSVSHSSMRPALRTDKKRGRPRGQPAAPASKSQAGLPRCGS
jgi:hypothetical protein